jgi:hypothetical protein
MCIRSLFVVLTLFLLSSCGGGVSGKNGDDPFGSGVIEESYSIALAILDPQCAAAAQPSFTVGESICIQATLSQDGNVVAGEIVNFSASLGGLNIESKLTDSNGHAQVLIDSNNSAVGAGTIEAFFNDAILQVNYELLAAPVTVVISPSISMVMLKSGQPSVRFKADEQVQLQSTVIDHNNSPVEGVIVNFVTTKGELNTSDALTDSQGIAQVTLAAQENEIGAGVATIQARVNEVDLVSSLNFEIQSVDAISEQVIRVGHFADDNNFIENVIGVSVTNVNGDVEISAGATLGLSVALVDQNGQRILTQTPVSFTSTCIEEGRSSIDSQVNTINGVAQATYEDISCAGSEGNVDTVVASLIVNNSTVTLTLSVAILGESIGSIGFVSAQPTQIVLQGTGGQNNQTVSTLVFEVLGALGNPLAQQQVAFSLNTATGGLTLSPATGITNSLGQVSTRVTSGSVPTSVRVTAEITTATDEKIRTQSDLLSVNTGLPDQNSMTLSASILNPEANRIDGQLVNVVARLSDSFNNPIPDGTAVSFTTEGGTISPSCLTENGACSVVWTSSNPRVDRHRSTILATAIGHETLLDSNGNNTFDDSDGGPLVDASESGFDAANLNQNGFLDMSEAWRDDNENRMRDPSEIFLDFNNNQQFDSADGLFNGPQCQSANLCGSDIAQTLHVRKSITLVMSSSTALWRVYVDDPTDESNLAFSNDPSLDPSLELQVAVGDVTDLVLVFNDTAGQVMPSTTRVGSIDVDGLLSTILYIVPNDNEFAGANDGHIITLAKVDNTEGLVTDRAFSFIIEAPSGIRTLINFTVNETP